MRIDIRWLLTPAAPFVLLGFSRAFFWVAGVSLEQEAAAVLALLCLFVGVFCGGCATAILTMEGISLGHIHLGRRPPDGGEA